MPKFKKNVALHCCYVSAALLGLVLTGPIAVGQDALEQQRAKLSPFMNSIPPSKDYFCVGTGPSDRALHPDRAPYTQLAQQDGVVLFSGTAPQQGLNFQLTAGSLVYRNQMSSLGSAEPSPQVGTAGTLQQRPWGGLSAGNNTYELYLPWSEARWHPGEDIVWQGYRKSAHWLDGLPYWNFPNNPNPGQPVREHCKIGEEPGTCDPDRVYMPWICGYMNGGPWNLASAINLQLARGIYQVSKVRADQSGTLLEQEAEIFREPWFQGRGRYPAFNVTLDRDGNRQTTNDEIRLAENYFPTYHNIYPYQQLDLDGGRLLVDFERSATWPRTDGPAVSQVSGAAVAQEVRDQYGNMVLFDRVPKYGWETDYKVPPDQGSPLCEDDPVFSALPNEYKPKSNAWRLPHKRLRTVQLFSAEELKTAQEQGQDPRPDWTIAFVYEHPESDRISDIETGPSDDSDPKEKWRHWRSIYSYLPQAQWEFGRLPELNDETTLLTVQAYKHDLIGGVKINGAPFQDDWSVWGSTIGTESASSQARLMNEPGTAGSDPPGDANGDGCPGLCEENDDDDDDDLIDEDSNDNRAYLDVDPTQCSICQRVMVRGQTDAGCNGGSMPSQTHVKGADPCYNPLYWQGQVDEDQLWSCPEPDCTPMDYFSSWDDDEDGLVDEDGPDDPLLVHLRAIPDDDECARGIHPFVPKDATLPVRDGSPGWTDDCRRVLDAASDPWSYQVQYVYARSNPYWLLIGRNADGQPEPLGAPKYYYYPPFTEPWTDANGDRDVDPGEFEDIDQNPGFNSYPSDPQELPHVHPDCVPDPDFRGPQGIDTGTDTTTPAPIPPVAPSDIHLIKRIVRMRPDVANDPTNYVEQVWLYRYNDFGFLKAVFDPASVKAL